MEKGALKELIDLLSFAKLSHIAVVVVATWVTVKLLKLLIDRLVTRLPRYRLQISGFFPILRIAVWVISLGFIVFVILSPSKNVVLAVSASAGLAVGLAAQDVLRNVFAGTLRLFDRSYRVGDMVQIGEHYGEVINVDIKATRLRTFKGTEVTIPSIEVMKQAVVNSNVGEITEMILVEFDLPATIDVQEVKRLAREAAVSSPYTYLKKPVSVVVKDRFERTFLTHFTVKAYVVDIRLERLLASDIIERIKKEVVSRGLLRESTVLGLLSPQNA